MKINKYEVVEELDTKVAGRTIHQARFEDILLGKIIISYPEDKKEVNLSVLVNFDNEFTEYGMGTFSSDMDQQLLVEGTKKLERIFGLTNATTKDIEQYERLLSSIGNLKTQIDANVYEAKSLVLGVLRDIADDINFFTNLNKIKEEKGKEPSPVAIANLEKSFKRYVEVIKFWEEERSKDLSKVNTRYPGKQRVFDILKFNSLGKELHVEILKKVMPKQEWLMELVTVFGPERWNDVMLLIEEQDPEYYQSVILGRHKDPSIDAGISFPSIEETSFKRLLPTKKVGWIVPSGQVLDSQQVLSQRAVMNVGCPKCGSPIYQVMPVFDQITDSKQVPLQCTLCNEVWYDEKAYDLSVTFETNNCLMVKDLYFEFIKSITKENAITVQIRQSQEKPPIALVKLYLMNNHIEGVPIKGRFFEISYDVAIGYLQRKAEAIEPSWDLWRILGTVAKRINNFLGKGVISNHLIPTFLDLLTKITGIHILTGHLNEIEWTKELRYLIRPNLAEIKAKLRLSKELLKSENESHKKTGTDIFNGAYNLFNQIEHSLLEPRTHCAGIIPKGWVGSLPDEIRVLIEEIHDILNP